MLLAQFLTALNGYGVIVTNVTFDGCPTSFSMTKIFGCNLKVDQQTDHKNKVFMFPDPSHMIKLIRNVFGEKKIFIDENFREVDFSYTYQYYITEQQENKGLHLGKLREAHIFFKLKMKVKLATQLLSRSVDN